MATLERERAEGQEARRIVESEVYIKAVETIRKELLQAILDAPVRDTEAVLQIKLMILLLDKLKAQLDDVMVTGKMAELQLERDAKKTAAQRGEK
jgi:hypothetical protein